MTYLKTPGKFALALLYIGLAAAVLTIYADHPWWAGLTR
jgi:hypothetical protein